MANFGLNEAILMLLFTVAATYTNVVRDSIILKQFEGQQEVRLGMLFT